MFAKSLAETLNEPDGKGFLFNVGNQRKPESLFPTEPTAGVFYLPSTQSRLVLLETVLS